MKATFLAGALAASSFSTASSAATFIVDFNSPVATGALQSVAPSFVSKGLLYQSNTEFLRSADATDGAINGTQALQFGGGDSLTISRADGSDFTFVLASIGSATADSGLLVFEFNTAFGISVQLKDVGPNFSTYLPFAPVSSVTILFPTGQFVLDDLIYFGNSLVPEPATWGLMIAGFAMTGAAVRRRRSAAIA